MSRFTALLLVAVIAALSLAVATADAPAEYSSGGYCAAVPTGDPAYPRVATGAAQPDGSCFKITEPQDYLCIAQGDEGGAADNWTRAYLYGGSEGIRYETRKWTEIRASVGLTSYIYAQQGSTSEYELDRIEQSLLFENRRLGPDIAGWDVASFSAPDIFAANRTVVQAGTVFQFDENGSSQIVTFRHNGRTGTGALRGAGPDNTYGIVLSAIKKSTTTEVAMPDAVFNGQQSACAPQTGQVMDSLYDDPPPSPTPVPAPTPSPITHWSHIYGDPVTEDGEPILQPHHITEDGSDGGRSYAEVFYMTDRGDCIRIYNAGSDTEPQLVSEDSDGC